MLWFIYSGQQIVSKRMFLPWYQNELIWRFTKYSKLLKKYRVFSKRLVTGVSFMSFRLITVLVIFTLVLANIRYTEEWLS